MRLVLPVLTAMLTALPAAAALATPQTAPRVGPLPKGPIVSVTAAPGTPFAVALPRPANPSGLVWRLARPFNSRVVRQVGEGEIGGQIVLTFRALTRGKAVLSFALTKGETSTARKAVVYRLQVR